MMAQKVKNPLAQALGLVLQSTRDKMGGISSTEIASRLGLAASHYRMIEAGSAILHSSRAIKIVQTFDTIEFIPLCQLLVAIQILDSAKQSIRDMQTTATLLTEVNPALVKVLKGFDEIWKVIDTSEPAEVAKQITAQGIVKELDSFLTTEPVTFTADQFDNFMTPTYQHPISGQLYNKIGNILQGVAPFYLDTVLQLIDNLKNITPRVTPEELAGWESSHKNRISHIIGIVRKPEIILDVDTFDYTFLWQENFQKMLIIHRDIPEIQSGPIHQRITDCLKTKFESERVKYERELNSLDEIVNEKLTIEPGKSNTDKIDRVLLYRDVAMNNLWIYIMNSGYVVPFIDNATSGSTAADIYGTSLAYDETCAKLVDIKELCSDVGFTL
jgi:hypothetical protein